MKTFLTVIISISFYIILQALILKLFSVKIIFKSSKKKLTKQ